MAAEESGSDIRERTYLAFAVSLRKGVSYGQFYKEHLAGNVLNEAVVDWKSVALSHVATSAAFDAYLTEQVRHARLVAFDDVSPSLVQTLQDRQALAVLYDDRQWRRVAKRFGLMEDEKEGIRRGTYRGVLPFTWPLAEHLEQCPDFGVPDMHGRNLQCTLSNGKDARAGQIEPGCPVPAVADGQVVAVFEDFMAQTIIMTHQEHLDGRQLATLLAHVVPVPGLAPGQRCSPDVEVAAVAASRTTAPAHVHLSVLAAAPGFAWASLQGWPDLLQLHEQKELHFLEPPVPTPSLLRRNQPRVWPGGRQQVEPWRAHLDLGGEQQ
ncbi:GNTI [Symbiodinium sp. KB8]|nr:GNTI [Symbiodinium sp. KB8]